VDDVLSDRSKEYTALTEQGVDFDELSLTELYELVAERPTLLKSPIMVKNTLTLIGYNIDEIQMLLNREDKKKEFQKVLNRIRKMEDDEFAEYGIVRIARHNKATFSFQEVI